ncbi:hypothetical protein SAMN04488587_1764 [Methanococcoides vulcani]|uniref:Uncharacterized protein n=1 Tax=Methanococcoides vulcani TaxID=1353158 RepID=A0A1I0AQW6_9EURY|nr:hypothetical protein [Methanococcoides vulcani]SES96711.1 hypothetical protein SAMN04488587_1764 [Methanococcoides vulcani]
MVRNIQNKTKGDQNKVWKILLALAAIILLTIAAAMILVDQRYHIGILYLTTSILFFSSAYLITTSRVNMMKGSSNEQVALTLGFIILTIGWVLNGLFGGLGFVLFLTAILSIHKIVINGFTMKVAKYTGRSIYNRQMPICQL